MTPGDLIEDPALGRGLVIYYETADHPICAFPDNPEMVVCDERALKLIANINQISALKRYLQELEKQLEHCSPGLLKEVREFLDAQD